MELGYIQKLVRLSFKLVVHSVSKIFWGTELSPTIPYYEIIQVKIVLKQFKCKIYTQNKIVYVKFIFVPYEIVLTEVLIILWKIMLMVSLENNDKWQIVCLSIFIYIRLYKLLSQLVCISHLMIPPSVETYVMYG